MIRTHSALFAGLALFTLQAPALAQSAASASGEPAPSGPPSVGADQTRAAETPAEDGTGPATAADAWSSGADAPASKVTPANTGVAGAAEPGGDAAPRVQPVATPLPTSDQPPPASEPSAPPGLGTSQGHVGLEVGLRTSFVHNSGFDPFAEKDTLVQFSAALGGALVATDGFSLALFLGYEGGGKESHARGEETELAVHRVLLAPELRRHLWPSFYAFARPSLGVTRVVASLHDSSSGASMVARNWGFSFDASGGAAFKLFGPSSGVRTGARAWVLAEGGYGLGSKFELEMKPEGDSLPPRVEPVDLGDLRLSGPFFRVMLAITY